MVKLGLNESQQQQLLWLILGKEAVDFIIGGKITKAGRDIAIYGLKKGFGAGKAALPVAGRLGMRGVGLTARGGLAVARANPYVLAATIAYVGYKNRETIADVANQLRDNIEDIDFDPRNRPKIDENYPWWLQPPHEGFPIKQTRGRLAPRKNKFNDAVKAGMKALKKSPYHGPKGKFTNGKKAFGFVSKVVSKIKKKVRFRLSKADKIIKGAIKRFYK